MEIDEVRGLNRGQFIKDLEFCDLNSDFILKRIQLLF